MWSAASRNGRWARAWPAKARATTTAPTRASWTASRLLGLRAEYRLASAWRVQARVENVFDTQYETVAFYNQPGRAAYLTLRYGK